MARGWEGCIAGAIALGVSMDGVVVQVLARALLTVVANGHGSGRKTQWVRAPAGHAGLALCSFMISIAHGAGLMRVPALFSLCMANAPAREITALGSLRVAFAAVGVHAAAM